jgi:hypothetical protein
MVPINFVIIFLLTAIFLEDMCSRLVHWFWFPALAFLLLFSRYNLGESIEVIGTAFGFNLLYIGVQFAVLTFYFWFKNRQLVNITREKIGWGDILFFVCLACYFNPVGFILFNIASLLLVIVFSVVIAKFSPPSARAIPLAGWQAVLFGLTFSMVWLHPYYCTQFNTWFNNQLLDGIS